MVTKQDFNLETGGVIEGEVALKSNADLDGFPVAYYGPDRPRSGAACGLVRCDAKGHFVIQVSPGAQYVYLFTDQPGVGADVDVQAGQTVHVTLRE